MRRSAPGALGCRSLAVAARRCRWRSPSCAARSAACSLLAALVPFDGLLLLVPTAGVSPGGRRRSSSLVVVAHVRGAGVGAPTAGRTAARLGARRRRLRRPRARLRACVVGGEQGLLGAKITFFYLLVAVAAWRCPLDARERDRLVTILMVDRRRHGGRTASPSSCSAPPGCTSSATSTTPRSASPAGTCGRSRRSSQPFPFGFFLMLVILVGLAQAARGPAPAPQPAVPARASRSSSSGWPTQRRARRLARPRRRPAVPGGHPLPRPAARGAGRLPSAAVASSRPTPATAALSSSQLGGAAWRAGTTNVERIVEHPLGEGIGATGRDGRRGSAPSDAPDAATDAYQPDNYFVKTGIELGVLGALVVRAAGGRRVAAPPTGPLGAPGRRRRLRRRRRPRTSSPPLAASHREHVLRDLPHGGLLLAAADRRRAVGRRAGPGRPGDVPSPAAPRWCRREPRADDLEPLAAGVARRRRALRRRARRRAARARPRGRRRHARGRRARRGASVVRPWPYRLDAMGRPAALAAGRLPRRRRLPPGRRSRRPARRSSASPPTSCTATPCRACPSPRCSSRRALGVPHVHTLHDYWLLCQRTTLRHRAVAGAAAARRAALLARAAPDGARPLAAPTSTWRPPTRSPQLRTPAHLRGRIRVSATRPSRAAPADGPGADRHRLTFGYLGQLTDVKGVPHAAARLRVRAPQRAAPGRPPLRLLVGGAGPLADEVVRHATSGSRRWAGSTPAARERFFRCIDCLVVPSEWDEPAGLVVAEAAARGIPVVGAAIGGIPEYVAPASRHLLFRAGDVGVVWRTPCGGPWPRPPGPVRRRRRAPGDVGRARRRGDRRATAPPAP